MRAARLRSKLPVKGMAIDVESLRAMAERVVNSEGLYLVDVELKGGRSNPLLRIYIDKQGGISHADCKLVSEQLSAMLDVEDPFPGSYTLEVSSPGLDRELRKPSDYQHFAGRRARLILRPPAGAVAGPMIVEGRLGRVGIGAGAPRSGCGRERGSSNLSSDFQGKAADGSVALTDGFKVSANSRGADGVARSQISGPAGAA